MNKKELSALLARAEADQLEASRNAITRLLKVVAEDIQNNVDSTAESRTAMSALISSSKLSVVSLTCQGLTDLLGSQESSIGSSFESSEIRDELLQALEVAIAREEQERQKQVSRARNIQEQGVSACLTKCLVTMCRLCAKHNAWRHATRAGGGAKAGGTWDGIMTMLLSMNGGVLYPALSQETTRFLGRFDATSREVIGVLGPLASVILLQPRYSNLRGNFLLKLSTALASSNDSVKASLIVFQAELLGFSPVHTAAHADLVAGWCCSLAKTALSLDNDAAWGRASRAIGGVAVFLLSGFREYGVPITSLLDSLQIMATADPSCLTDEVAFLGIMALQSQCIDDRETLLEIVGRTLSAMPIFDSDDKETSSGNEDMRSQTWSLESLVYPVVGMAAGGNKTAAILLPLVEVALSNLYSLGRSDKAGRMPAVHGGSTAGSSKSLRHSSDVALAIRRLSSLADNAQAIINSCNGLTRQADNFGRANGSSKERDSLVEADLECGFCLLSPLLLRANQLAHKAACATLVAVVRAVSSLGTRLLPFVLYAIRKIGADAPEGWSVTALLHLLPELGAHKLTAKPVASVVQALAKAPQSSVQGLGLRLAAALVQVNPRTFDHLQSLLSETPENHITPLSPEPDESRLCRAAGLLEICEAEPELGLECVRPLQDFLRDSSGAVTAMALKAVAALCRGDCLESDTALRIVTKKGKVAHTGGGGGTEPGDPRVMVAMAELCGAGAEAAALAAAEDEETGSDDSGDDRETRWDMANALEILLEHRLGSHPDESVRTAVYSSIGSHLPALLRAATGKEAEEDAIAAAQQVREFLGNAVTTEASPSARLSLEDTAIMMLNDESVDPSSWGSSIGAGTSGKRGGKGREMSTPSNRLLDALPAPESVFQAFRQEGSSCRGSAGAVLWCYPTDGAADPTAYRDAMIRDFGELMVVEGAGAGLAFCPWQQAGIPVGIQRYVARMFAACVTAEQEDSSGVGVMANAVDTCRKAIVTMRGVREGFVEVARASLVSCLPASCSHIAEEEISRVLGRLRGCTGGVQSLLDGEEMIPICAAMVARALSKTSAKKVEQTLKEVEQFRSSTTSGAATPQDALSFWSCVAVGVASEWSLRHPAAPEAKKLVLRAVRSLLLRLADAVRSTHISAITEKWYRDSVQVDARPDRASIIEWEMIDIGQAGVEQDLEMGVPTTRGGSSCLALFLGLSHTLSGLRGTGLHLELLQVFNIVRALALKPVAGLCGATLCLATAASECFSCGLIDAPVVLSCLRSVSVNLDASADPARSGKIAAQDTCLGAAGLIAVCEGKVTLPAGFVESMFEELRKGTAQKRGANNGARVVSFLALASLVGCPLICCGELVPRQMRVSSITNRKMVENLLQDVTEAMEGTSLRPKNAAARVWGCLCALGQDERALRDVRLREALGWTERGEKDGDFRGERETVGAISPDALSVAREGTLMKVVLTGLQSVAVGAGVIQDGTIEEVEKKALIPAHPALFARSALTCLASCSVLKVSHPQMALVVEALFRGGHGADVQMRCVSLALAFADKEPAYSTWLNSLYKKALFINLPDHLRRHLVSVVDQVYSKLPSGKGTDLVMGLWDTIASTLFTSSGASVGEKDSEGIAQVTIFLSRIDRLASSAAPGEAMTKMSRIEGVSLTFIYPYIVQAFRDRGDVKLFHSDVHETAFWDAVVSLLSRFSWKQIHGTIAQRSEAGKTTTSPEDLRENTLRAYLSSRLAPPGEAPGGAVGEAISRAATNMLGSVARWVTRMQTNGESSAAVLPHLAEGVQRINTSTVASEKWVLMLLDAAELPECCPKRTAVLLGGATVIRHCSSTGLLIVGENAVELWGRGNKNQSGAVFFSMSVTAPRLVVAGDDTSKSDLSSEILRRLFRLSSLLAKRAGESIKASNEHRLAELGEVRRGVEGFIRGLRHTSAVLLGPLSGSFASYAESVATDHALL